MKNIIVILTTLLVVGCSSTYTLRYGKQLSPATYIFNDQRQRIEGYISQIDIPTPYDGDDSWNFVSSQLTNDTTYFTILYSVDREFEDLKSSQRFSFRSRDYLRGRVVGTDSGALIQMLTIYHSNDAIPSGNYQAVKGYYPNIGRGNYLFGGYTAKIDTINLERLTLANRYEGSSIWGKMDAAINPHGLVERFIKLLDDLIDKLGGTKK